MGYLTTVTIYNDGAHMINPSDPKNEKNIRQLAQAIYDASLGIPRRTKDYSAAIGSFANMVEVQDTRHADDHTTYVHMGNCVTEVNPWSEKTKALLKNHPEFASKLIQHLKQTLKKLSELQKDLKEENSK